LCQGFTAVNVIGKLIIDQFSIFLNKSFHKFVQGEREAESGKVLLSHGIAGA